MEKLTNILGDVLTLLRDGLEVTKGEIPLLIQDFLNWGIIKESRDAFIAIFLLVISIIFQFRFKKKLDKSKEFEEKFKGDRNILLEGKKLSKVEDNTAAYDVLYYLFLAAIVLFSIISLMQILDIFKIIFAPRVYLIEEISKLIATKS